MAVKKPAGKAKNKGGRPPFQPTDEQRRTVAVMAAGGIQRPTIAFAIGIAENTLLKYFGAELENGSELVGGRVVANLYRQATKDDFRAVDAAKFWAKTRMGWREKSEVEHSGGLAINIGKEFDGL